MDTSKSIKKPKWFAGAYIFSGRPDPTWTVNKRMAKRLEEIWYSLEPWSGKLPLIPPLGYRGCFLRDVVNREWFAYSGMVKLNVAEGSELRRDRDRTFEKLLLSSAPEGVLPPSLFKEENTTKYPNKT